MVVTGLFEDMYLVNNPIWLQVSDIQQNTSFLEIAVSNVTDPLNPIVSKPLRLHVWDSKLRFNLQEIIKGNFPLPKHPETLTEGMVIGRNLARFTISIMEVILIETETGNVSSRTRGSSRGTTQTTTTVEETDGDVSNFTKSFIRGGESSMRSNLTLSAGTVLKESEKIPRWGWYPTGLYQISVNKRITYNSFVPDYLSEQLKIVGCDPLYVRFLNTKGGYSFWLFESYEQESNYNDHGSASQGYNEFSLGTEAKIELRAETRVNQRYFNLIEALLKSPEIHAFQKYGLDWAPIQIGSNNFVRNNYEKVMKVDVTFKVKLNESPSLLW